MPDPEFSETPLASDSALLRQFAADASRTAFTEIVRRHRGLVFATAMRITGDEMLAEEASQNVFAILARKAAAVARYDQPGAWLHRTAVFEARKRLRTETRHRRKMAALEASPDNHMNASTSPDAALHDLLPHVDECVQRLRPAEQDALRMRYMENRSHAEVAAALGKSEDAGKKHTARALERLCALLRCRGVVSTAALAASLQAGSRTASAISAESLTSTALSLAQNLTRGQLLLHALNIMTTKQTTAAAAALLLLCSAPVLWQERAIAHARTELAAVNVPPPSLVMASAAVLTQEQNAKIASLLASLTQHDSGPLDLKAAVAVAAKRSMGFVGEMPRYERMKTLNLPELQRLFAQAAALPDGDRERTQLLLISLMAEKDLQAALKAALQLCAAVGEEFYDSPPNSVINELSSIYALWMKQDWRAALASYEKLRAGGAFAGRGIRQDGEQLADRITSLCCVHSPEDAKRLFATLKSTGRVNSLQVMATQARTEDRAFVLAEAERLEMESPGHSLRQNVLTSLVGGEAGRSGPEAGMKLLNELKVAGEERRRALAAILHSQMKAPLHEGSLAVLAWAKTNLAPDESLAAGTEFLGNIGDQRTRNAAFRAFDWGARRDAAIAAMLGVARHTNDAVEAVSLAREITDRTLKIATLQKLSASLPPFRRGAGFLAQIEGDPSLSPEERATILNPPKQP